MRQSWESKYCRLKFSYINRNIYYFRIISFPQLKFKSLLLQLQLKVMLLKNIVMVLKVLNLL